MLIIGFATHCTISQYHFEIVADLASLTFGVLQAAVLITSPIFRETPAMRHWRASWITAEFILVFVAQFITYQPHFLKAYGMSTQCIWNDMQSVDGSRVTCLSMCLLGLSWAYMDIMSSLYPSQFGWSSYLGYLLSIVLRVPSKLHSRTKRRLSEETTPWGIYVWGVLNAITYGLFVATFGASEFLTSVFCSIVRIFAMLLWASKDIIDNRSSNNASLTLGMQGDENQWTVGQVMLLLLLFLPLFRILETYYG